VEAAVGGDDVIFFELPHRSMRGIKVAALARFFALFRRRRFDIVIAHRYKPIYFAGAMSYFFDIPVLLAVVHEHDVFRRPTRRLFVTFWCPNLICIGVSESVADNIEASCGELRAAGRLFTLHHAIDTGDADRLLPQQASRQALGLQADRFYFGTVGRLVDKKDHEVLLSAFARFRQQCPDAAASLVLIGSGPREAALRAEVDRLGITADVHFTGHVDAARLYMKALDVFVLPSGAMEAFGMVLLEAMLARVPIVTSSARGPAEVVGDAARLFGNDESLADQLVGMWQMPPGERTVMAERGAARLTSRFTLASFKRRIRGLGPVSRVIPSAP